jgi:hypothetical protein
MTRKPAKTWSKRFRQVVKPIDPDRTGGAALPVAHDKRRDLTLWCEVFRLAFPSRIEMRAVLMVEANTLREQAFQVAFVNCNDVIQEITAGTPYPTVCDSILPRTFEQGRTGFTLRDRTAAGISSPYLASRSKMMNLGADPDPPAFGCLVTLKWRIPRRL